MKTKIEIQMRGVNGTLYFSKDNENYEIPVEYTGDYKDGLLVFINELDHQITSGDPIIKKREIRRALQDWGKENNTKFSW